MLSCNHRLKICFLLLHLLLKYQKLFLFLLKPLLKLDNRLLYRLIFIQKPPVIFLKLFCIVYFIDKIRHTFRCQKQLHISHIPRFIQVLNPKLHGLILPLLRGLRFLIGCLSLLNLHLFICQIAFQYFNIQKSIHQLVIQAAQFVAQCTFLALQTADSGLYVL